MDIDVLKSNIDSVRERVMRAAERIGTRVTVVAATKTVDAAIVNAAVEYGLDNIGENRVQEYLAKRDAVKGAVWHFIGTLQRNKVKYLVGNAALIQSVSSLALATEIDRLARSKGIVQDVLIEVNADGEPSKTGADISVLDELIASSRALAGIRLRGLMAIPSRDAPDKTYDMLKATFDRYSGGAFDTLSVGMSGDFERAIAHGGNMVRIGSAIFGQRL